MGLLFGAGAIVYIQLTRLGLVVPIPMIPQALCLTACQTVYHRLIGNDTSVDRFRDSSPLVELLDESVSPDQLSLLVEKSAFRLTVFHQGNPIKTYPIVLGGNPSGDKLREGDRKTPEGIFKIRDQYPHPTWSKFIWLDYPTADSWRKHWNAKLSGEIDPLDTIGGEVGIHGVPNGADDWIASGKNWTLGCVSLTNADINEIYAVVGQGTVVEILP